MTQLGAGQRVAPLLKLSRSSMPWPHGSPALHGEAAVGSAGPASAPHLLPLPAPQVLTLLVLLLPHGLQFSLVGPSQALQLTCQVRQQLGPLLPLLRGERTAIRK